jgi:hypothetical protein
MDLAGEKSKAERRRKTAQAKAVPSHRLRPQATSLLARLALKDWM